MHEIVTLQCGQQSNYLGTHFWNAQESYFTYDGQDSPVDHNVHFRAGQGTDGSETFTPRVLIYDFKPNFGSLRRDNALYGLGDEEQTQWSGAPQPISEPRIAPSEYQLSLERGLGTSRPPKSSVRYWSDYNRIFYHPRSLIQLSESDITSSLRSTLHFSTGEELFATITRNADGVLDRDLRPLLEECDQLQGLQVLSSTDDAWGGFASSYLDAIRDEMGKTAIFTFGLEDGSSTRDRARVQTCSANVVQSTLRIAEQSSVYVPVTSSPRRMPGYIKGFDEDAKWHTAAIQALGIESVMLFARLKNGNVNGIRTLDHCAAALNNDGKRRIAHLEYTVKNGATIDVGDRQKHADVRVNGHEAQAETDSSIDMMPTTVAERRARGARRKSTRRNYADVVSERGPWADRHVETADEINHGRDAYVTNGRQVTAIRNTRASTSLLFPVLDSFPDVLSFDDDNKSRDPQQVAVRASMATDSVVAQRLEVLADLATSHAMRLEDRESLKNGLVGLCEEYGDGLESADASDDYDE